jgi:hypothetical protein
VGGIGSQVWPTRTSEDPKARIVRCGTEKLMQGRVIGKEFGGSSINEINGCKESFIPVRACKHERARQDPSPQCGDVSFQRHHFVGVCVGKILDVRCQPNENVN